MPKSGQLAWVGHQLLILHGPCVGLALVVDWQLSSEVLLSCGITLACLLPCEMMLPPGELEDFVQFCFATEAVVASAHRSHRDLLLGCSQKRAALPSPGASVGKGAPGGYTLLLVCVLLAFAG